jgi:hypothetical protein
MAERKPPGVSFETWVDRQIREAADRGEFDNLPGAGKPLPNWGDAGENWWLRSYLQREELPAEAVLPVPIQLRKELDRLPGKARAARSEAEVRELVRALNRRIRDYWRFPSGPQLLVPLADEEAMAAQWRDAQPVAAPAAAAESARPAKPRWWRRRKRR